MKDVTYYEEVSGDVIEKFVNAKHNAILMHGANCQRVMGTGVAGQIREQLSPLYFLDLFDKRTPPERFGNFSAVVLARDKEIMKIGVNLYTQFNPGANFDITALKTALKAFKFSVPKEERKQFTVYLPKIGAGIGGGDWKEIEPIIKTELSEFNVVLVKYSPPKKEVKED